jgi:cytochrome P450
MIEATPNAPEFPLVRDQRCPFDPPPDLATLQRECPVSHVRIWSGESPWLVSRYDDVRTLLTDERVSADTSNPGYPHPSAGIAGRRRRIKPFMNMDDPDHAAQRRLLTPSFMVKKMEAMRPKIQQIADDLLDTMLAGPKPADLVQAYALPIPSLVICELLGVPYGDRGFFHRISHTLIARESTPAESVAAAEELLAYLESLIDKKAVDPGDDVLSRLVVGPLQSGGITRIEIATLGQLLLVAGHETTANMIALGTAALLAHPGQLAEIRDTDHPDLVGNAVEEMLRYLTVTHSGRRRVALADIEIGGQVIRQGEGIIAALDIANRDESAFPNPDELDIHRSARHHLAFGYGVHQCLGQPLARVELQVAYRTLLRRAPTLRVVGSIEDLPYKHDMAIYGIHELPVTW